jgi:hypothetical protein
MNWATQTMTSVSQGLKWRLLDVVPAFAAAVASEDERERDEAEGADAEEATG